MDYTIRQIQTELKKQGYNPGSVDGILGRKTMQAVRAYQIQHPPLAVDGIAGPRTLAVLFARSLQSLNESKTIKLLSIPWLEIAISKKGLHEKLDNEELRKFLKSDGGTIGDPSVIPWCGDFVETCIALSLPSEVLPINPYLARNWMKFGEHCEPMLGAIASFWRTDKDGIFGHVAFIVGKSRGGFAILGGNQENRISVTTISGARLLDTRWPLSTPIPHDAYLPVMEGGKLSLNEA